MKQKKLTILFTMFLTLSLSIQSQNSKESIQKIAEKFVKAADLQDANMLERVLHPKSQQFVSIGSRLIMSSAEQYIESIKLKRIGGKPRTITFKELDFIGKNTAFVILEAKSTKLNFKYQLSVAKNEGKWCIISVMTEVKPVK